MIKSFKEYIIEEKKEATFTFGRFNPPTVGHEKLLDSVAKISGKNKYFIFASHSNDKKKNPLEYQDKIKFMRSMFPRHARNIIQDDKLKTIFAIATHLYSKGFNSITMVVGSDRIDDFKSLLTKYNGVKGKHGFYEFDEINFVSAGQRDPDAEGVSGMSASKMREAAADNNFVLFSKGMPNGFKDAKQLFNAVRNGMGLQESHDFRKHIQLEQVSEEREAYVKGDLFKEGDVVEYNDTVGQVIFLGSNYIIVESAEGIRSRKWLTDITLIERTDKDTDQPKKYMSGIDSVSTKKSRATHFKKGAEMDDDDPDAYKPAPGDATAKTKPSDHTKKYKELYGEEHGAGEEGTDSLTKKYKKDTPMEEYLSYADYNSSFEGTLTEDVKKALQNKSEKTGVSYPILKKVYDRGVAAWRTGHRPGTTPEQWGLARVNSFVTGGKTQKTTDSDLWKKHQSGK
jgi:hypothetical protein